MLSPHAEALARLYAAAIIDDRSVLDPILGARDDDGADAIDDVCTGFAGTLRFLRFVGGQFAPYITLGQISERGSIVEVRGCLKMNAADRNFDVEIPFTHRHTLGVDFLAFEQALSDQ